MTMPTEGGRAYRGPTFLDRGFRPFFFGAGVFAAIAVPIWVAMLGLGLEVPSYLVPRDWHIHEMIFGYVAAVVAGFLLTAVPNWTGRLPVAGRPLAALFGLWLLGRIAMALSGLTDLSFAPLAAAIVDAAFLVALAAVAAREVAAGKNIRNLPICGLVALLAAANIGFHWMALHDGDTGLFQRLALAVIAALITLVGGRIVPSFSRNWMVKAGLKTLPAPFDIFDKAAMLIAVVALLAWIGFPETTIGAALFALGAIALAVRVLRWRGWTTFGDHLVLILHVGYAWLPIWFGLMALHGFRPDFIDNSTAMHALTAGAAGTMTIAVMTRASLGHSGRALTADRLTSIVYALIVLGATARVLMPFLPLGYMPALSAAGLLWSAGFGLFAIGYGPLLFGAAPFKS
jgi:uncharacterized protein involved in response to NO